VTGIRERRREQLLENLNEMRRYWKMKAEPLDRILWRTKRLCTGCKMDYRMPEGSFLGPIHIYKLPIFREVLLLAHLSDSTYSSRATVSSGNGDHLSKSE
jgi:hypothetical protein